jgi:hypothetical protein
MRHRRRHYYQKNEDRALKRYDQPSVGADIRDLIQFVEKFSHPCLLLILPSDSANIKNCFESRLQAADPAFDSRLKAGLKTKDFYCKHPAFMRKHHTVAF